VIERDGAFAGSFWGFMRPKHLFFMQ